MTWYERGLKYLAVALAGASVLFLAFLSAGLFESRLNNVGPLHLGAYVMLYGGGVAVLVAALVAGARRNLVIALLVAGCVTAAAYVLVLLLAAAIV